MSRRVSRRFVATFASVAACAALPASAQAGVVTEFSSALTAGNAPANITAGPDGNLWFTEQGLLAGVARITPTGAITEFPTTLLQTPGDIVTGPDGGVWFTETGLTNAIARIDPSTGAIVEHSLPDGTNPQAITAGPDGNLWFTEVDKGKLGRMTPAGDSVEYDLGLGGSDTLNDVTTGPDGKLWFTVENPSEQKIGRLKPADGSVKLFTAGLTGAPDQITAASDGKLYFTEPGNPAAIGRIKTDGSGVKEYRAGLAADAAPSGIAQGSDGGLWFTGAGSPGRVGRMSPSTHEITEHVGGAGLDLTGDAVPTGIASGADGNLWFTENAFPGRIGRMALGPVADLALTQKVLIYPSRHEVTDGELQATISPNSQDTTYHVEYGPDASYGSETAESAPLNGAQAVTELVELPLDPSSHYHARVVATNAAGEGDSADVEMWTDADGHISDYDLTALPVDPEPTPTPTATATPTPTASHDQAPATTTPAADIPVAPPVLGESVVVHPLAGSVRVKSPGARTFHALGAGAQLPVGTLVDTRAGRIVLQSARDAHGRTQAGTFWGGVFQIRQRRHGKGMTDLVLRGGGFSRCGTRASVSVLAREAKGKRRVVRRLWGKDSHSRFRTHGRDSVATVRGTRWVTTDRCDGTLTRVTQGKVSVRDLHRKRSVLVRAGHAYLARHRHRHHR